MRGIPKSNGPRAPNGPVSPRFAILQELRLTPESYAWGIRERLRRRTNGQVCLGRGTVFMTLYALQKEGLVEPSPVARESYRGHPYKLYQLTPAGRKLALELAKSVSALCSRWEVSEL